MTKRQLQILVGLASDARDLKVENGWYGDPAQGDSTRDEDDEAIRLLEERLEFQAGREELLGMIDLRCEVEGDLSPEWEATLRKAVETAQI